MHAILKNNPLINQSKEFLVYLFVLSAISLDLIVEYTPILRESIIGYSIVFIFLPLILIKYLFPIFLIYAYRYNLKSFRSLFHIILGIGLSLIVALYIQNRSNILEKYPPPLPTGSNEMSFNKELWEKSSAELPNISFRQRMLKDVINKLPGKSKQEVITMLGESVIQRSSLTGSLDYNLGYGRGFSASDELLFIYFDENEMFKSYRLVYESF